MFKINKNYIHKFFYSFNMKTKNHNKTFNSKIVTYEVINLNFISNDKFEKKNVPGWLFGRWEACQFFIY